LNDLLDGFSGDRVILSPSLGLLSQPVDAAGHEASANPGNVLLADADPLRNLQARNALIAEQDHPRPASMGSMGRAASDQSLENLSLAWFEVNVSHARTNRACTRKLPLNSYALH